MNNAPAVWFDLESAYADEWGDITPEVSQAVNALREQADNFARATLRNEADGRTLLAKAAAIVSRTLAERPGQIADLQAYLLQTYKRQVLAELRKEKAHQQALAEHASELTTEPHGSASEIERQILIRQITQRMNPRTRQVFELLILGHSFEEIGQMLGLSSRAVRNNYYDQIKRLKQQIIEGS